MGVVYTKEGETCSAEEEDELGDGCVQTVFMLVTDAPSKAKRKLALAKKATVLDALAAAAGVDRAKLAPLASFSSGIYTEDDYLAQLEEDWEREEYGPGAAEVVKRNHAAWQSPAALLEAIEAALAALADPKTAQLVLIDDYCEDVPDALRALRTRVERAVTAGASSVCLELDEG